MKTTDTLAAIRQGLFLDELGDAIAQAARAARTTGKGAKVSITLTLAPIAKGQGEVLNVADTITVKLPSENKGATVLYANEDGDLSRNDPRQPKFAELREVVTFPAGGAVVAAEAAAGEAAGQ